MWPWLVGALSAGSTILVFDGSPFKPTPMSLWELSDQEGVTAFGTSAKYIGSLEQAGIIPSITPPHHNTDRRKPCQSFEVKTYHVYWISTTARLLRVRV